MKAIPLTQGRVAKVSDRDYAYLSQWKWHFDGQYAAARCGGRKVRMHRVVAGLAGHRVPKQVDHRDRDKLNNQRRNLRPATMQQQRRNQAALSGTSRFKGVSWVKRDQKWRATIMVSRRQRSLGHFDKEIDAARAYNRAAKKHFGRFAFFNKVA